MDSNLNSIYFVLQLVIKAKYGIDACNVGNEGDFAPSIARQEFSLYQFCFFVPWCLSVCPICFTFLAQNISMWIQ